MDDSLWIIGVRLAGVFHFVTLLVACVTPIPPDWDTNLSKLPLFHRRFARAQNFSIGATIAALGLFSACLAPELITGAPLARAVCAAIALFWFGRLAVLPWLNVGSTLTTAFLRLGFRLLMLECAIYGIAFGWLAFRPR